MTILFYIAVTIGTYALMEIITWFTHKYIMHGFLWYLHEDHHQPKYNTIFEKNDSFFLIFAIPSALCYVFGSIKGLNFLFFIGAGISLYGLTYFVVHDVIIHRRFNWFKNVDSKFIKAIRKGHKIHHKHMGKEDGECFGLLWVPKKFYTEAFGRK